MSDFSDSDSVEDNHETNFSKAAEHVQRIHVHLTPNDLLELYALYKQATLGRCNTSKPGIFNMQARAKWSAWHDLADMTTTEAQSRYVAKVSQLDPKWSDAKKGLKSPHNWVVHSVQLPPQDDRPLMEHEKTAFDYVKEGNVQRVRDTLTDEHMLQLDGHGMGLLHWATDRNSCEILELLLLQGANVNLQDAEGQTALHYAASCAHLDCLHILLKFGANQTLRDAEGQSCWDVADDEKIRQLLDC